ncbi:hypothetical protein BOSP111201_26240 [Bordetella sputigena]
MTGCATSGKGGTAAGKAAPGGEDHGFTITFLNLGSDNLHFRQIAEVCMILTGPSDFWVQASGWTTHELVESNGTEDMCVNARKSATWSVSPSNGNISYVHLPTSADGPWAVQIADNTGKAKSATCTVDGTDQNCPNTYAKGMDLQEIQIVFQ